MDDNNLLFGLIGVVSAIIVLALIFYGSGVNLPSAQKLFQKREEAELKSKIVNLDANQRPRLICKRRNFAGIISKVIYAGKDPNSGLQKLQFFIEDDTKPSIQALDSPNNIRFMGSFADFLRRERKVFEIIQGDAIDNLSKTKSSVEIQNRALMRENEDLRKSHKGISKDYAETYKNLRQGMFGNSQNFQSSGMSSYSRPWGVKPWNRSSSFGSSGGEDNTEF